MEQGICWNLFVKSFIVSISFFVLHTYVPRTHMHLVCTSCGSIKPPLVGTSRDGLQVQCCSLLPFVKQYVAHSVVFPTRYLYLQMVFTMTDDMFHQWCQPVSKGRQLTASVLERSGQHEQQVVEDLIFILLFHFNVVLF